MSFKEYIDEAQSLEAAAKKISNMTYYNDHFGALVEVTKLLKNKRFVKIAKALETIRDAEGHAPMELIDYEVDFRSRVKKAGESKFGSAWQVIHNAT